MKLYFTATLALAALSHVATAQETSNSISEDVATETTNLRGSNLMGLMNAVEDASTESSEFSASDSSDVMALMNSMEDADACLRDCNDYTLGKKSKTKTKKTESEMKKCYNGCFYHKDGTPTRYTRSVGSDGVDDAISCTNKCAKNAEKSMKKADKKSKDSKKYTQCKSACQDSDDKDQKKCLKKCDKDEDKRISKEEDKQKKSTLKSADKCTSKCVMEDLFEDNVVMHAKYAEE